MSEKGIDYSRLREGLCPLCDVALVRRDDCGECPECSARWSLVGDTINLHVVADTYLFDEAVAALEKETDT